MATEVETLILRFRDLATRKGQTLALHQEIAAAKGSVWWGWWHKFGERVPLGVFRELKEGLQRAPLDIYLFDSGANRIHLARCAEIRWDESRKLIAPPDLELTPDYYEQQEYFAWFRLLQLSTAPLDPLVVRRLAYVEVPEFFESGVSPFTAYDGKRIESLDELLNQNRSVWFVRASRAGDAIGPPRSEPAQGFPEAPFSTEPLASPSTALLWLSDVHFGSHAFPLKGDDFEQDLPQVLEQALKKKGQNSLAGAIISGDLTWKNDQAEFVAANDFLNTLRTWSTLQHVKRILMCPGNHDFKFTGDPSRVGEKVTVATAEAVAGYADFYGKVYGHKPNVFFSCGRRFLVGGAMAIDVVALNTSLLEQSKDAFQGQGFVGDKQLVDAANQMGWTMTAPGAPRAFRVLVLHHHLVPVSFRPRAHIGYAASITWDAEAVIRWVVEHKIDLVLHGHQHDPFIAGMRRPIPGESAWHSFTVAGMGSSGVDKTHLGDLPFHTFGLVDFGKGSYSIEIVKVDAKGSIPKDQTTLWRHTIAYTHFD